MQKKDKPSRRPDNSPSRNASRGPTNVRANVPDKGRGRSQSNSPGGPSVRRGPVNTTRTTSERISSPYNDDFQRFYGIHACQAIFKSRPRDIVRFFVSPQSKDYFADLITWCDRNHVPWKMAGDGELSKIAATQHHEGVCVEAAPTRLFGHKELVRKVSVLPRSVVVYLEGVENPHNLGAALRTCAFFGIDALFVESYELSRLPSASCRIAEGGAEIVPTTVAPIKSGIPAHLKRSGFTLCATTPHEASSLYRSEWDGKIALMFGAEGSGLSPAALALADRRVAIPGSGLIESLNVASAVAVLLAEVRRNDDVRRGGVVGGPLVTKKPSTPKPSNSRN